MKYSVQNPFGEVYGTYNMPDTDKSPEILADELRTELGDILGLNGVMVASMRSSPKAHPEDRVIIDVGPTPDRTEMNARLARVHRAVGKLAVRRQGSGQIRLIRPDS